MSGWQRQMKPQTQNHRPHPKGFRKGGWLAPGKRFVSLPGLQVPLCLRAVRRIANRRICRDCCCSDAKALLEIFSAALHAERQTTDWHPVPVRIKPLRPQPMCAATEELIAFGSQRERENACSVQPSDIQQFQVELCEGAAVDSALGLSRRIRTSPWKKIKTPPFRLA